MDARVVHPDPRIDALRGAVAFERGPLVLCAESIDLPADVALSSLRVVERSDGADAPTVVAFAEDVPRAAWPYGASARPRDGARSLRIPLIPYHSWAERGPSTMRVWLPAGIPSPGR